MSSFQKSSPLSGTDFLRMYASAQAAGSSSGPVFGPIRSPSSSASSSYGGSHCQTSSALSDTESCRSTPQRPTKSLKDLLLTPAPRTTSTPSVLSGYGGSGASAQGSPCQAAHAPSFASPAFKQAPSAMDVPLPTFL